MPAQRRGDHTQYLPRPVPRQRNSPVSSLLDGMRADLAGDWPVERMAAVCHMSRRNFVRHFADATGTSPGQWRLQEWLALARDLLRTSRLGIDKVAQATGFASAQLRRHHFRRRTGLSPGEYPAQWLA